MPPRSPEAPAPSSDRALRARRLTHRYEGSAEPVLRDLELAVGRGELVAIVGPSGVGKTTLLHLLAGLETPGEGEIEVGGRPLPKSAAARARLRRTALALVPQGAWLDAHLSAADNVALPLLLAGPAPEKIRRRCAAELEAVGCAALASREAGELSAGERARVALARGLVGTAGILLADEPTGNLDAVSRERIVARLERAARYEGRAVVVATHDPDILERADRVLRLADGRLELLEQADRPREAPVRRAPAGKVRRHGVRLAWMLTRGFRGRMATALAGVACVVAILLTVLGLLVGGGTALRDRLLGDLPEGTLKVLPARLSLGLVELSLDRFRGGRLDGEALEELAALEGVGAVYPQLFSSFPVTVAAEVFGRGFRTDVALEGVDPAWLAGDVPPTRFAHRPGGEGPVPVVLSDSLLALFNAGFARSHGLPRLGPGAVRGLRLDAVLGRSSFDRAAGEPLRAELEIVGFSSRVSPLTLAVPLAVLDDWNRRFAERAGLEGDELAGRVAASSAILELVDAAAAPGVIDAVEALGFRVEEGEGLAPRLGRAVRLASLAVMGLGLVLLGVFTVLASQLFASLLALRRRVLDLLEVLGASGGQLVALLAAEVAVVTAVGTVAGMGLAWLLGGWIGGVAEGWAIRQTGLVLVELFRLPPETWLLAPTLPLVTVGLSLPGSLLRRRRSLPRRLAEG